MQRYIASPASSNEQEIALTLLDSLKLYTTVVADTVTSKQLRLIVRRTRQLTPLFFLGAAHMPTYRRLVDRGSFEAKRLSR
jgi:hypothetical protein